MRHLHRSAIERALRVVLKPSGEDMCSPSRTHTSSLRTVPLRIPLIVRGMRAGVAASGNVPFVGRQMWTSLLAISHFVATICPLSNSTPVLQLSAFAGKQITANVSERCDVLGMQRSNYPLRKVFFAMKPNVLATIERQRVLYFADHASLAYLMPFHKRSQATAVQSNR